MDSSLLSNLGFDPAYILIAVVVLLLLLLGMVIHLQRKYNRLKNQLFGFTKGKDGKALKEAVCGSGYQKTGIVKYDAFENTGGKLSFALTLLDENNNGFIFNSLHTGDACYSYLKEIVRGESYVELSQEESESLDRAIFQEAYGFHFQDNK